MPVRKFRSIEEMNQVTTWRQPGDPMLYRAIAGVWELARRTNPRRFPPGVHKYRSIEDMDRVREQCLIEHVQALARQRRGR
jgi:hypothetical protein